MFIEELTTADGICSTRNGDGLPRRPVRYTLRSGSVRQLFCFRATFAAMDGMLPSIKITSRLLCSCYLLIASIALFAQADKSMASIRLANDTGYEYQFGQITFKYPYVGTIVRVIP